MKNTMDLLKAVGFIILAIFALVVAPMMGAIVSTAVGIWLIFMVIREHKNRDQED